MRANTWLCRVDRSEVVALGGAGVEKGAGFVAEGAWAGDFGSEGLLNAPFVVGSGVVFDDRALHCVGPTHSVEPVYCFVAGDEAILSNSIHAIIAYRKGSAPPSVGDLRKKMRTARLGITDYVRVLYETPSGTMHRYLFGGFTMQRSDFSLRQRPMVKSRPFDSFSAYKANLLSILKAVKNNARDVGRKTPYTRLVTTCSRGYDSAASTALGKELGAGLAVTLANGRGGQTDTGAAIAAALGLECTEYGRLGHRLEAKRDGEVLSRLDSAHIPEEGYDDFLASAHTAEDLYFVPFEPHLRGAVVLTGFHGGKVWAPGCPSGPSIQRADNSGTGLDEFRKRVGFVMVPVPFIGADRHRDIAAICESDEMAPFTLGGKYDKPIARRIGEEAGIPREAFGQKKLAGSVLLTNSGERRKKAFKDLVSEYRTALAKLMPL